MNSKTKSWIYMDQIGVEEFKLITVGKGFLWGSGEEKNIIAFVWISSMSCEHREDQWEKSKKLFQTLSYIWLQS